MLLILLIIFLVILCFIERELDTPQRHAGDIEEKCHRCGSAVSADHLICEACNSLLQEHCGSCGHSKVVSHQYCPWCGTDSSTWRQYAA